MSYAIEAIKLAKQHLGLPPDTPDELFVAHGINWLSRQKYKNGREWKLVKLTCGYPPCYENTYWSGAVVIHHGLSQAEAVAKDIIAVSHLLSRGLLPKIYVT